MLAAFSGGLEARGPTTQTLTLRVGDFVLYFLKPP